VPCFIFAEKVTKFVIIVGQDEEGIFVVECPSILGCVSQGKIEREAVESIEV